MSRLDDVFAPHPVPEWLLAFEADPDGAIDALLWKRFYFGPLNVAEPEDLLIDWAILLQGDEDFQRRLDGALAVWADRAWGTFPEDDAARLADAWTALAHVATNVEGLDLAMKILRDLFPDRDEYLGPLSLAPSRDPLGRYLGALAAHQEDRTLSPFWWQLCDLPEGTPFYHASYALAGLLGLPAADEGEAGGFRQEVARGLARLARAFNRLVERGELPESRATSEVLALGQLALAALPFPSSWQEALAGEVSRLPARSGKWLQPLLPSLAAGREGPSMERRKAVARAHFDLQGWLDRTVRIAKELRMDHVGALEAANVLLAEQEMYAQVSGNASYLARSLHTFAEALWDRSPAQALEWAKLARRWAPGDPFTWNTLTQALRKARGGLAALAVAREAVERFPSDLVARISLAKLLVETGLLEEAEAVHRVAVEQFPDHTEARRGPPPLAARKAPGVGERPESAVSLGDTFRIHQIREAPTGPESQPSASRRQRAVWTSEARFLRRWARRGGGASAESFPQALLQRAEDLLDMVLRAWPHDARALAEKGFLLLDGGRTEEAWSLLSAALARLPGSPVLVGALARAEREKARQERRPFSEASAEIQEIPLRLRALHSAFEPLTHLQRGRAILALSDGHARLQGAARPLERLHEWMRPRLGQPADTFEGWWSRNLQECVFAPLPAESAVRPEQVEEIAQHIERNASRVDFLEEDFLSRLVLASAPPLAA